MLVQLLKLDNVVSINDMAQGKYAIGYHYETVFDLLFS